jgi:bifunctional DNA-binding transcriptional regulator/antitoxin component of YhaV-PrlF toxin-antitoxin module
MPSQDQGQAELMVPKSGRQGQCFPVRGTLRGHEGEWFRVDKRGFHHNRVVRVGPDGRSEDTSYRVRAEDFVASPQPQTVPNSAQAEVSIVGQRGTVVIAARLRERLGIGEGSVVIQEEREGGVWIRPADVTPRASRRVADLNDLVDRITPENLHSEVSTEEADESSCIDDLPLLTEEQLTAMFDDPEKANKTDETIENAVIRELTAMFDDPEKANISETAIMEEMALEDLVSMGPREAAVYGEVLGLGGRDPAHSYDSVARKYRCKVEEVKQIAEAAIERFAARLSASSVEK